MALYHENPLVSICVPVYNGQRFIKDALDSIIRQSYENKEIIVSDNVSTDKTPDITQEYVQRYGIRYCRLEHHLPAGEYNFNRCLELSKGKLICIYHADDVYNVDIISRSVEILCKYENVGVVFTMANKIDGTGKLIGRYHLPKELKKLNKDFYSFNEIFSCVLKYGNAFLVCPSAMVRKSIYDELGGWEYERYNIAADLGLWLKIAKKYDIAIVDSRLMDYRISKMQLTSVQTRQRIDRGCYLLVMDDYLNRIKGHRLERYYDVHRIIDLTYRALNLSAAHRVQESDYLIKKVFSIYFKNLFKIPRSPRILECLLTITTLLFVNRLPGRTARIAFRDFVLNARLIRAKLGSLLEASSEKV